ncbi:uncharacterized protein UV8b_01648 [Ustilaginoidea virens]|uniref:Uncharacterized protein n=1 Tax=Ustilaginoidea virens TaxID=1159556 RepID=A0A8E5MFF8_USTVR|nr:uncharacterized protein UV8b_01648 [Ustilaginoidea virens]QUC17407.1 hypothetical protein UV8b_01648 [Ustilaginoidea virens]
MPERRGEEAAGDGGCEKAASRRRVDEDLEPGSVGVGVGGGGCIANRLQYWIGIKLVGLLVLGVLLLVTTPGWPRGKAPARNAAPEARALPLDAAAPVTVAGFDDGAPAGPWPGQETGGQRRAEEPRRPVRRSKRAGRQ